MDRSPTYMLRDGVRFVGHEPCPECQEKGFDRAGNNLGRWADGHGYCFSCKYFEPGDKIKSLQHLAQIEKNVKEERKSLWPSDAQKTIDVKALNWLSQYGIIRDEILFHDLSWSDQRQWLLFPYKDDHGRTLAWQARNFGSTHKSKWLTEGPVEDIMHILGFDDWPDSTLVIVEDIVSAIKVSRVTRAMPLFGSVMSLRKMFRTKVLGIRNVAIWLDADKFKEAIKYANRLEHAGVKARTIFTEKDPKECSMETIQQVVNL